MREPGQEEESNETGERVTRGHVGLSGDQATFSVGQ